MNLKKNIKSLGSKLTMRVFYYTIRGLYFCRSVQPASQKPDPISHLKLRFFISYPRWTKRTLSQTKPNKMYVQNIYIHLINY